MPENLNALVGYWAITDAPNNTPEASGNIYLRFTDNGLLQWGYENQRSNCVISFQYWIDGGNVVTIREPQPRKEYTPFSISTNGKLELQYSYYETTWVKAKKQDFFESKNIWDRGDYYREQLDYLSLLKLQPGDIDIRRADYLGIAPQILINTHAMSQCWSYYREPFASFHLDDFEFILDQGVLIDDEDNEDRTLLSYLAEDGHTEAVRLMLDHGAEINHLDIYPFTALDYATQHKTIVLLRERGAKLASELE
jgi:hypothetical protein